jgi:ABC-type polysaccharide/polyol phosphate transport system ATPase subunit
LNVRPIDIAVTNLGKRYRIPRSQVTGDVSFLSRYLHRKEWFWAVRDVNFEIFRGEAFGIVGHNGAGKSTLIKLLSGITVPSCGQVAIRGTLSALIEVGAGFNFELTGRENVFLAGSILGMGRREIIRSMGEILEIAGIGKFIDAPVKTYSSGQYVRLGFAIAAQLEHDIFLLDEVLAVGDIAFQERCFRRIDQLRQSGKTLVLISHDLAAIERICDRAILMRRGEVVLSGPPREVIDEYTKTAYEGMRSIREPGPTQLMKVHFEGGEGGEIRPGSVMIARVKIIVERPVADLVMTVAFYWPSGYLCTQLTSKPVHAPPNRIISFDFLCPVLTMQRGLYRVDIGIEGEGHTMARWIGCSSLRVDPGRIFAGDFLVEHACDISVGPSAFAP